MFWLASFIKWLPIICKCCLHIKGYTLVQNEWLIVKILTYFLPELVMSSISQALPSQNKTKGNFTSNTTFFIVDLVTYRKMIGHYGGKVVLSTVLGFQQYPWLQCKTIGPTSLDTIVLKVKVESEGNEVHLCYLSGKPEACFAWHPQQIFLIERRIPVVESSIVDKVLLIAR